jgi:hypothetical protein
LIICSIVLFSCHASAAAFSPLSLISFSAEATGWLSLVALSLGFPLLLASGFCSALSATGFSGDLLVSVTALVAVSVRLEGSLILEGVFLVFLFLPMIGA